LPPGQLLPGQLPPGQLPPDWTGSGAILLAALVTIFVAQHHMMWHCTGVCVVGVIGERLMDMSVVIDLCLLLLLLLLL
jgi:hypothetical protein